MRNKRIRYLSAEQEQQLLDELSPDKLTHGTQTNIRKFKQDNFDFVTILIDTGARYSEIANLKWSDVSLEFSNIKLYRNKVDNESILYMTDRVKQVLQRRKAASKADYVFTAKDGVSPRSHSTVGIKKAFKRAGLDEFTVHDLRHSFASKMAMAGMSLQEIAMLLGHSSTQMTEKYAHLIPTDTYRKAVQVIEDKLKSAI